MRERRAEERHHGVADELLDRAAEALELVAQTLPVRREQPAHVLGVEPFRPRREPDEVGEENRDELPLLTAWLRNRRERRTAGVAEAGVCRGSPPAPRSLLHAAGRGR